MDNLNNSKNVVSSKSLFPLSDRVTFFKVYTLNERVLAFFISLTLFVCQESGIFTPIWQELYQVFNQAFPYFWLNLSALLVLAVAFWFISKDSLFSFFAVKRDLIYQSVQSDQVVFMILFFRLNILMLFSIKVIKFVYLYWERIYSFLPSVGQGRYSFLAFYFKLIPLARYFI